MSAAALAAGAVGTAALADGSVTGAKLSTGRVPIYSIAPGPGANSGALTLAPTCSWISPSCGVCGLVPRYETCSGACPACQTVAVSCTDNNVLRGYLVAP